MMLCILPSPKISSSRLISWHHMDPMDPQLNHIGPYRAAEGGITTGEAYDVFLYLSGLKLWCSIMFHLVACDYVSVD